MSLTLNILTGVLKAIHAKRILAWVAKNPPRSTHGFVPEGVETDQRFKVKSQLVNKQEIATIERNDNLLNKPHIFFLHGGAYLLEALPTHWALIKNVIQETNSRITFLDYPLTPEYDYMATFDMVSESYDLVTRQYANDEFVFMGDSAGGGLAFAFNQKLILEEHPKLPIKTILLSPWLDLSLSHPDIDRMEKKDVLLSRSILNYCANHYAGRADQSQYMLSP